MSLVGCVWACVPYGLVFQFTFDMSKDPPVYANLDAIPGPNQVKQLCLSEQPVLQVILLGCSCQSSCSTCQIVINANDLVAMPCKSADNVGVNSTKFKCSQTFAPHCPIP